MKEDVETRAEALERSVQFFGQLCRSPIPGNKPPSAETILNTAKAFDTFLRTGDVVDVAKRERP
jgi:hypothetical protein